MAASECYSCGGAADPKSPRNFCKNCDKEFSAGEDRQKAVEERADRLEQAKADGDKQAVGQIMTELFEESVIDPTPDAATAKKVSE